MSLPTFSDFWSLRHSAGGPPATRFVSQPIGAAAAWTAGRMGLHPNQVTLGSLTCFALGAAGFCVLPTGVLPALMIFAVLQLAYGLDCADGQLARATRHGTAFGAWLDLACDYVRSVLLAGALLLRLLDQGMSVGGALVAAGMLAAGAAVQLHTGSALKRFPPALRATSAQPLWRMALATAQDTPVMLTLLVLLRETAMGLFLFGCAYGGFYLAQSMALARARLPRAEQGS